jgi:hypothetical protein
MAAHNDQAILHNSSYLRAVIPASRHLLYYAQRFIRSISRELRFLRENIDHSRVQGYEDTALERSARRKVAVIMSVVLVDEFCSTAAFQGRKRLLTLHTLAPSPPASQRPAEEF